jgi:hypothetical integral membrane protein (TIGR02206 family)
MRQPTLSLAAAAANSDPQFRALSPFHLGFLLGTLVGAYLISEIGRRSAAAREWLRIGLAIVLTMLGLSWYVVRLFIWREGWRNALPLEMCDASLWLSVVALLWPNQRLREMTFYWSVSGGFMALLTPDLLDPQWSFRSLSFLFGHAGLVIAGVFLLCACGPPLPKQSWWRALLALNLYAACVAVIDLTLHTDYMFLFVKPAANTLLDYMGPWPVYILSADLLAAGIFYAMYKIATVGTTDAGAWPGR